MDMERTYTVDELLSALRRRWVRAVAVAAAVLAVAVIFIARLPSEYRAKAMVMVEPSTPHPDLVTPVISTTLEEKVKSVKAQVYSRGLLAPAIEELKLYPKERERGGMEAAVELLRKDTEVNPEGDNAFTISVRSREPETAARVANRLAELFIEGNLQVRQGQVQRTREIISSKLDEMRTALVQAEQRIATFKREHQHELPELLEARLHERGDLARQQELTQGYIQTAQAHLDLLGTQPPGKDTDVGRLQDEEGTLRAQFSVAASSLTPDHPDVQRLARQVGEVHARLERARTRANEDNLEERRMRDAVRRGRQEIDRLDQRMASIDKVITAGPGIAAQLSDVSRDADLLRAKVGQLVSKKAEAEIAAELEQKNAPNEFRVLETASPPALPSSPNRSDAFMLALLGALLIGGATVVGQEMSDHSLRTGVEANQWLALPVLATVPSISAHGGSGRMLALPSPRRAET
jgi:polysaccharide biosynthesis transport protein